MLVNQIKDNEDGSVMVNLEMTKEEHDEMMGMVFRIALMEGLKLVEEKKLKEFQDENK